MFQSYQLKSCFLFTAFVAFITLALRIGDTVLLDFFQCLGHLLSVMIYGIVAWLIQGYFRYHPFLGLEGNSRIAVALFFGILAILILNYLFSWLVPPTVLTPLRHLEPEYLNMVQRLFRSFFLCMVCSIAYNTLETSDFLQRSMLENEQLKQEHLRAQLISLQEQISPHFLFNSLSILKTIAADRDTKDFVLQLSHIYRYVLSLKDKQVTTLSEEMAFVNSYLYIMRLRFEAALFVEIDVPAFCESMLIPPLSVQLLVENAIKHNAISVDTPIWISITTFGDVALQVCNTRNAKKVPVESTKLGLQNIGDRFRLLFGKSITINRTPEHFIVILPLTSYENYHH
ncbi:sensor histidine kinase [Pedobacter sp. GR22-6]|uniref:sensor histidine kinase n=1 Tax=Pedobacter sp. GR22-6 TaxID=3127957 RepID=UPI00307E3801